MWVRQLRRRCSVSNSYSGALFKIQCVKVKDGRWAFTEIPKIVQNNPDDIDQDIYGKLRAPWNINERA